MTKPRKLRCADLFCGAVGAAMGLHQAGFEVIGLHTLKADVTYGNFPSMNLLERHGFLQEAHFREDVFKEGKFLDTVVYGRVTRK